jgi:hypothetical protein
MSIIEVPRELLQTRTIRRRTKIIIGAMVMLVIVLFMITIVTASDAAKYKAMVRQVDQAVAKLPQAAPAPALLGAAETAAIDYLSAQPYRLPTAQGVSSDLGRSYQDPTTGQQVNGVAIPFNSINLYNTIYEGKPGTASYTILQQFLVQGPHDWLLTVPIQLSGNTPVVVADPTLLPYVARASSPPALTQPPQNGYSATLSSGAISQIDAWAQAWVSNNQQQLYQLAGDTSNQTFFGLGGWTLVQAPQVVNVEQRGQQQLVTIILTMAPNSNSQQVTQSPYQLLLQPVSQPLPDVVAWGPAGVGWSLKPYQQAVPGPAPVPASSSSS